MIARSVCCALVLLFARTAVAHSYEPSLLEIEQRSEHELVLRWFPSRTFESETLPVVRDCSTNFAARTITATCATDTFTIVLPPGDGEVLVMWQRPGAELVPMTRALGDTFTLALRTAPATAMSFLPSLRLGLVHIATGVDHLLFVGALVALFGFRRRLLWLITGFSLGHSITLGLGAYGVVRMPPLLVEAWIALSLVLLARELVRGAPSSLLQRQPLIVASAFGLVHGCGFASALTELGVHGSARVPVLLGFNLGVELGQLAFVALLACGAFGLRRFATWAKPLTAYAVGTVGVLLLVQRVALW